MIIVCPSDQFGCGKYRMIWPAEALQAEGVDIRIQRRPRILVDGAKPPNIVDFILPEETKVVVFQRPGSYQISQLIPLMHKRGIKVVIDMDDDLATIHPRNLAYAIYDPKRDPHRNWEWAKKACGMADLVTATTEALLDRYASHGRGALIPNCIPDHFFEIEKKPNELVTVGWAGWTKTHPEDLQITHGAVNEALAKQDARFMAIGDSAIFKFLQIRNRYPHVHQPGVSFDAYAETVSTLDIGIVPLADTEFNQAKSWLKALEYAALGVAPVVSPTPDNLKLVEDGAAYVARSPKAWKESIKSLVTNESERIELANRAKTIASKWRMSANAWRWRDAWCNI